MKELEDVESVYRKTPMARKEALDYCRRCLAVMLCCVLVFGLTVRVAPRAKAVVGEATAALAVSGGAFSAAPVAGVLGACALVVAGVDIGAGYVHAEDSVFYGTRGYNMGAACWDYLENLGGDIGEWCMTRESSFNAAGGVAPGDTFEIPAEVVNAVKGWVRDNIDFTDGVSYYTENGVISGLDCIVFSKFWPDAVFGKWEDAYVGTVFSLPSVGETAEFTFSDKNGVPYRYVFTGVEGGTYGSFTLQTYKAGALISNYGPAAINPSLLLSFGIAPSGRSSSSPQCLTFFYTDVSLSKAVYGTFLQDSTLYIHVSDLPSGTIFSLDTTITETAALDVPAEKAQTVAIPVGLPMTMVDGLSVPIMGEMTASGLTQGKEDEENPPGTVTAPWDRVLEGLESIDQGVGALSGQIADAVSGTMATAISTTMASVISQAQAQQVTVEEAMEEPESLGAVFTSKFPFCIPWDLVKSISLFAAQPVTPHFEFDFFSSVADVYGGFGGADTAIVIDFGLLDPVAQVCRWVETVIFIYALASGTKRYIWTA